ncbi:MAG: transposase [Cyanobacteria bacterium J06649_11]
MIPTPGRLAKHYAIGAVNYHTGEMIVIFRKHKKRIQMAEFLRIVLAQFSDKQVILVWDTVHTHKGGEVLRIEQEYPQRLKLMYLPTYSPWLNPIEML